MPDDVEPVTAATFWQRVSIALFTTAVAAVGWNYMQLSTIKETEIEIRANSVKQETIEALRTALELIRAANSLQDQNIARIDQLQKTNVQRLDALDARIREVEREHKPFDTPKR